MDQANPSQPERIQRAKHAPPPPELPIAGRGNPAEITFLGRTNYVAALEEKRFIFGIKRTDRKRHMYLIGKPCTGKSKLIELMLRQDIAQGSGACLIDPKGDVIDSILDFIPENRVPDVAILDPQDTANPVAWNPLANVPTALHHQFAHGFTEILSKQFGSSWSPRLEHLARTAILTLLPHPGATLHDISRLLRDESFRKEVAERTAEETLRVFWQKEFDPSRESHESEAVLPLVNKLAQFLGDPMIGNMFRSPENRFDLSKLIAENKIVLVNLARTRISEANAIFLGSLALLKIKEAALVRLQEPGEKEDFYLYLDEFPNLGTETFETLLAGSRKYGLCFTVVQQHLSQLPSSVQASVMGNMGSLVIFRVSGEDAVRLKPEMAGVVDTKDLINLGVGQFYMRIMIDGETYDPFSAETLKVFPPPNPPYRTKILESSRREHSIRLKPG